MLGNISSTSYLHERGVEESRFYKLHSTKKGLFNDSKGVTDQLLLTENHINKLRNLYRIALSTLP